MNSLIPCTSHSAHYFYLSSALILPIYAFHSYSFMSIFSLTAAFIIFSYSFFVFKSSSPSENNLLQTQA
ncbi:hypothetical protein EV426DRAFT_606088 [Tirmania nivea]|nr:hypothetical protein EV426DRAFT_606088 [Tirmania nivea]